MDAGLAIAILLAVAFAATNGLHDAANAIATLVATRGASPRQAIALATIFTPIGPLLIGGAVANTIGGIVTVAPSAVVEVIGFGLAAAVAWNLATVALGLPSSSGQALVGGLVGAALLEGGFDAVRWGGLDGIHPVGVLGVLLTLAISPPLGAIAALLAIRAIRRAGRRATRRWAGSVRGGQWTASAALAFSHGAQDANISVGAIAAMLLAQDRIDALGATPTWTVVACALALTAGTAVGGWRIIRTVGRRIYRLHPDEGLASEGSAAAVVLGAAALGGPASTTQVVASSVVGVGAGRRRFRHVRWQVVQRIGLAWLLTMPVTAGLAIASLGLWRWAT